MPESLQLVQASGNQFTKTAGGLNGLERI